MIQRRILVTYVSFGILVALINQFAFTGGQQMYASPKDCPDGWEFLHTGQPYDSPFSGSGDYPNYESIMWTPYSSYGNYDLPSRPPDEVCVRRSDVPMTWNEARRVCNQGSGFILNPYEVSYYFPHYFTEPGNWIEMWLGMFLESNKLWFDGVVPLIPTGEQLTALLAAGPPLTDVAGNCGFVSIIQDLALGFESCDNVKKHFICVGPTLNTKYVAEMVPWCNVGYGSYASQDCYTYSGRNAASFEGSVESCARMEQALVEPRTKAENEIIKHLVISFHEGGNAAQYTAREKITDSFTCYSCNEVGDVLQCLLNETHCRNGVSSCTWSYNSKQGTYSAGCGKVLDHCSTSSCTVAGCDGCCSGSRCNAVVSKFAASNQKRCHSCLWTENFKDCQDFNSYETCSSNTDVCYTEMRTNVTGSENNLLRIEYKSGCMDARRCYELADKCDLNVPNSHCQLCCSEFGFCNNRDPTKIMIEENFCYACSGQDGGISSCHGLIDICSIDESQCYTFVEGNGRAHQGCMSQQLCDEFNKTCLENPKMCHSICCKGPGCNINSDMDAVVCLSCRGDSDTDCLKNVEVEACYDDQDGTISAGTCLEARWGTEESGSRQVLRGCNRGNLCGELLDAECIQCSGDLCNADATQRHAVISRKRRQDFSFSPWIGVRVVNGALQYASGLPVPMDEDRFNLPTSGGCMQIRPWIANLEWIEVPCETEAPYICQSNSLPGNFEAVITNHPENLSTTLTSLQNGDSHNALVCESENYRKDMPVIWVKEGVYYNNGPAPEGFTLHLNSRLASYFNGNRSLESLAGIYHCEVWGGRNMVLTKSNQARVTIEDVVEFRLSLHLQDFEFTLIDSLMLRPEYLPEIQPAIQSILSSTEGVFSVVPKPLFILTAIRQGSVILDFKMFYHLSSEATQLLQAGAQMSFLEGSSMEEQTVEQYLLNLIIRNIDSKTESGSVFLSQEDITIRSIEACPSRQTQTPNTYQPLSWFSTKINELGRTKEVCLSTGEPIGTAFCHGDYSTGAFWGEVTILKDCPPVQTSPITPVLMDLADVPITEDNVNMVSNTLYNATEDTEMIETIDVIYIAEVLNNIVQAPTIPAETGEILVSSINNVLHVEPEKIRMAEQIKSASSDILRSLDIYTTKVELPPSGVQTITMDKIATQVWELDDEDESPTLGFGSVTDDSMYSIQNYQNWMQLNLSETDAAILLSQEVLDKANELKESIENFAAANIRLSFYYFNGDELFTSVRETDGDEATKRYAASSHVIAGSVHGIPIQSLSQPVLTAFQPYQGYGENPPICGFWVDNIIGEGGGFWSTEGCHYNQTYDGRIVCFCDHLTNFAILTDITGQGFDGNHGLALDIISIIGLVLSIVGLSLVILTFFCFKKVQKGRGPKVLVNLAIAMLLTNIIFLAGITQTKNDIICSIIAAVLQYLILAQFCWMVVEAVLHYLKFVKVINDYVENFMLKASLSGWGIPAIPIIVVAAIDHRMFRGPEKYCWLNQTAFLYAFLAPIGAVMLINTILFIIIIRGMRQTGVRGRAITPELMKLQVRTGISCFVLLGLTWIFGFLAIEDTRLFFQYLFCIFNAFTGFYIFLLHNVRDQEIRKAWAKLLCCSADNSTKYTSTSTSDSTGKTAIKSNSSSQQNSTSNYDNVIFQSG